MAQFLGRKTDKFDSPGMRGLAANWLPAWGTGSIAAGEGANPGYWDIGPDGKPIAREYLNGGESGSSFVPFFSGGGEGGNAWTQDLNALVAQAQQSGALTPQKFVEVFNKQIGNANAALNPDGTISYDAYSYDDEGGFLDRFMDSPMAPVALFSMLMGGVGGFGDLMGSFGPQGPGSAFAQAPAPAGGVPFDPATAFDVATGQSMSNLQGQSLLGGLDAADAALGRDMLDLSRVQGGNLSDLWNSNVFQPKSSQFNDPAGGENAPGAMYEGGAAVSGLPSTPPTSLPGGAKSSGTAPKTELDKIKDTLSISSAVGSLLSGLSTPNQGELSRLSRASDATRRQVINQNLGQIEAAFSDFDDKYFNSIADAFRRYYEPQVDDTFKRAAEQTIYAAPGGVGSTAFASKLGEVERDRSLASVAVGEQAAEEAQRAKANIEGTKSSLIGLAESSEDPGTFGAQAVAAAKASAQTPSYNPLADLFSRYANLAASAGQAQRGGYGTAGMSRPTSFGGSSGGSSSSVKTVWS